MPIDTDSDDWKNATSKDPLQVEIQGLLLNNRNQAFSIQEIDEYLAEEHPLLFPADLVGEDSIEGAKASRQSIIANILESRFWHSEVSFKSVESDDGENQGMYFTHQSGGINPIAEVDDVKTVDPDSPFMTLSSRFRGIEKDMDSEVSELDDRISRLEYRVQQELGVF